MVLMRLLLLALILSIVFLTNSGQLYAQGQTSNGTVSVNSSMGTLSQANIIITSFLVGENVSAYSSLPLYINLTNDGQMASDIIRLNILMSGAGNLNFSVPIEPLSPSQSESVTIYLINATQNIGKTYLGIDAGYILNHSLRYSNVQSANFTVSAPQTGNPNNISNYIVPLPELTFVSVPLYTSLNAGKTLLSFMGLFNTGNEPEYVNISMNSNFTRFLTLSTNGVYIGQNQTLDVDLLLRADPQATPGLYLIPINLTVSTASGFKKSQLEYLIFTIFDTARDYPTLSSQINLINHTNTALYTIGVNPPNGKDISYATLKTILAQGTAGNISQIKTYGLRNNITFENGTYAIKWSVGRVPQNQVSYAYYTVQKPANQQSLLQTKNIFFEMSQLKQQNIIRLINTIIPQFYTNSTNYISVQGFYTGTIAQTVTFTLVGPPGVRIYNASQKIDVVPNQFIYRSFRVDTGRNSGTLFLNLYINASGINATYTLPAVVLQSSIATTISQNLQILKYFLILIFLVILILTIYILKRRSGGAVYTPERVRGMIRIREQLKRSR